MIIKEFDIYKTQINNLISKVFKGHKLSDFSILALSSIIIRNHRVIAHAGLQERKFDCIVDKDIKSYILGLVCVDNNYQKKGYGALVIKELINEISYEEYIILLNCGDKIVPFYKRLGFDVLTNKASYERDNKIVIDNDPVMGYSNNETVLDVLKQFNIIHLGKDF